MKIKIYISIIILVASINAQWLNRSSGINFYGGLAGALDAVSGTEAVIGLAGSIYKTADAGLNWEEVAAPPQFIYHEGRLAESIIDIAATDIDHIWIVTEFTTPFNKGARIFASADGGQSWVKQFDDPSKTDFFNYIEMFDDQNGIAMGDVPMQSSNSTALFLKTTDGGATWIHMNQNSLTGVWSGDTWRRIDFVSPNIGYFFVSGINPQKIYKTTNGGTDWIETGSDFYAAVLKFFDESIGLAATSYGDIHRTTDGGSTWQNVEIEYENWPDDIEFSVKDPSKVWYLNSGKLFFSSDMGASWTEIVLTESFVGMDIEITEDNKGWLLTQNAVYFNSDALSITTTVEDEPIPQSFELYQNYPNPFNPETKIKFSLPTSPQTPLLSNAKGIPMGGAGRGEVVDLKVFDLLGNEIATLINSELEPGTYEVHFSAAYLSSGVYFYSLKYGNNVLTKKMTVLK